MRRKRIDEDGVSGWTAFGEFLRDTWERWGPASWFRRVRRWYHRGARRRVAWLWESCVGTIVAVLRAPWVIAVGLWQAFRLSWQYATWRAIWLGMPFVACCSAAIGLLAAARAAARSGELPHGYVDAGRRAMNRGEARAAMLYYERVLALRGGFDSDALFQIALAADQLGREKRVDAILRILAPVEEPRYAPAHVWRAERLLEKKPLSADDVVQVHTHLRYAVELDPRNPEAHRKLGSFYYNRRQWDLAIEHLTVAARHYGELWMPLARAHTIRKNRQLARFYGERAVAFWRQRASRRPRDVDSRIRWADALVFLERFAEAEQVLQEGRSFHDDLLLRKALSRVYVVWADNLRGDPDDVARKKLGLLEAAMNAYPHETLLFNRLMELLERGDQTSEAVEKFLVAQVARGHAPRLCHLLLGTVAGRKGNYDRAIKHLEQAYALDRNAPVTANNLAWYMLQAGKTDLKTAYEMVSKIAARWPNMAAIHDTRGHLLVRMKRYREALREFEKALPAMAGQPGTHRAMAEAYAALGMAELAAEHRRLADRLSTAKPEQPVPRQAARPEPQRPGPARGESPENPAPAGSQDSKKGSP